MKSTNLIAGAALVSTLSLALLASPRAARGGGNEEAAAKKPADAARKLPAFAPAWKKGQWWIVRTFLRDVEDVTGVPSARSAFPTIPGYPPLRDGVPVGFSHGNRWRLEVSRFVDHRFPGDAKTDAPERFVVVTLRALEGRDARNTELW